VVLRIVNHGVRSKSSSTVEMVNHGLRSELSDTRTYKVCVDLSSFRLHHHHHHRHSTWPTPIREHATSLSTYLQETLNCIEFTGNQPVPADLVKTIIHGMVTFVLKTQNAPDLTSVCDALRILQTEAKSAAENNTKALSDPERAQEVAEAIRQTTTIAQQAVNMGEETRAAAKEAATMGKTTMKMAMEIRTKGLQNQTGGPVTYAAMAVRGQAASSIQSAQPTMPKDEGVYSCIRGKSNVFIPLSQPIARVSFI
jgi:hypothetical protein